MHELAALGDGKGAGTAALYMGLVNCRQLSGRLPQDVQLMVHLQNRAAIAKYGGWGLKQIQQVGAAAEATNGHQAVVGVSAARHTASRPLLGVPATGAESRPDLRFPGSRVLAST